MIVNTILFKTWKPANVPSRLVMNDDGLMRRNKIDVTNIVKRHANNTAATRARVVSYLQANPWSSPLEIMAGLNLSKTAVFHHVKALKDDDKLEYTVKRVKYATIRRYKLRDVQ